MRRWLIITWEDILLKEYLITHVKRIKGCPSSFRVRANSFYHFFSSKIRLLPRSLLSVVYTREDRSDIIGWKRMIYGSIWSFNGIFPPTVISLHEIRILTLRRITPVREEEICFNFFFAGCCSVVQSRWTFPLFSIFLSLSLSLLRFSFLSRTEDSEKRVIAFSSLSLSLSFFPFSQRDERTHVKTTQVIWPNKAPSFHGYTFHLLVHPLNSRAESRLCRYRARRFSFSFFLLPLFATPFSLSFLIPRIEKNWNDENTRGKCDKLRSRWHQKHHNET